MVFPNFNLSLNFREMQIKTTMRYYLTLIRMATIKRSTTINAGEDVEKREPSYTVGRNIIGTTTMENYGNSSKTKTKAAI